MVTYDKDIVIYIIAPIQKMQLTQLQRSVDLVTPKGENHKGEQCFYAYL